MEFHLVTGSKGGSGKTLLSLMMLIRCLERQKSSKDHTLIIDLNNMNVDFSRLLLKTGNGLPHDHRGSGVNIVLGEKCFGFYLVEGLNSKKFIVAQPRNPFETHNYSQFQELILDIVKKSNEKNWVKNLFGKYNVDEGKISRVIIDTNYHFATLFPMVETEITKKFKEINIKIWFLWVYAQVEALLPSSTNVEQTNESSVVLDVSQAVECAFSNPKFPNDTPFRHVISTIAMLPLETDTEKRKNLLISFKNALVKVQKILSPQILQEENGRERIDKITNVINAIPSFDMSFDNWIETLKAQYDLIQNAEREGTTICGNDTHLKLATMIAGSFPNGQRSKNIYPFATYDPVLYAYTDKSNEGFTCATYLQDLKGRDIYGEFVTMLDKSGEFL